MLAAYASTLARRTGLSVASTVVPVAVAGPSVFARCYANVVDGLKYYEEHEWVKNEGGVATIGITDHAQEALGDIVYVDLPEVGSTIEAKESIGAVESVKAASDIYTPVSGEVVEANEVNAKKEKAPPFLSPLIPPLSPALLCFAIKLRSRNLNQTLASSTSLL